MSEKNSKRGRNNRRRGGNGEREVVNLFKSFGISAIRKWQTAMMENPLDRDVDVRACTEGSDGKPFRIQVKRKRSMNFLVESLAPVDAVFLREDGSDWMVLLRATEYLKLIGGIEPKAAAREASHGAEV